MGIAITKSRAGAFAVGLMIAGCRRGPAPDVPRTGDSGPGPKRAEDVAEWSVISGAMKHGSERVWADEDGTLHSKTKIQLRGMVLDLECVTQLNDEGLPTRVEITGTTPWGDAAETFAVQDGVARWTSSVDAGEAPWGDGGFYAPLTPVFLPYQLLIGALRVDDDGRLPLFPGGVVASRRGMEVDLSVGGRTTRARAVALDGLGLGAQIVWVDEHDELFAVFSEGLVAIQSDWEDARDELLRAHNEAAVDFLGDLRKDLQKTPEGPVVFRGVTIFDAATTSFVPGMSVTVEGAKIAAVGRERDVEIPEGARVIDGRGKTLVPGLWDMHYHFVDSADGILWVSQGITSVRDMGSDAELLASHRRRVQANGLVSPTLYALRMIDGVGPRTAQMSAPIESVAEGLKVIAEAKRDGYHGIKLYSSLDPAWVEPLATEAHRLGLTVQGHLPGQMRPSTAIDAGFDEINHIMYLVREAVPEEVLASGGKKRGFVPVDEYAGGLSPDAEPMKSLLAKVASEGTVIEPTLSVYEMMYGQHTGVIPSVAPFVDVLPGTTVRRMKRQWPGPADADPRELAAWLDTAVKLVGRMHAMGIPIVPGTDWPQPWPLVRELELYVAAGMSEGEALATATIGAARVVGVADETGSIAPHMDADLLLVEGDVASDIGALRRVQLVMLGGDLLDGATMRQAIGLTGLPRRDGSP